MIAVDVAILSLAIWRFASLLANEKGPYEMFDKFRHLVGVKYTQGTPTSLPEPYGTNEFAKMILCVWCNSVWLAFFICGSYFFLPKFTAWICLPFALSSMAIIIDTVVQAR